MNFLIQLKYGFCPKSVCSKCGQCISVTKNLAHVKSFNVPCITYGFAEVVSAELENSLPGIFDVISMIQKEIKKEDS